MTKKQTSKEHTKLLNQIRLKVKTLNTNIGESVTEIMANNIHKLSEIDKGILCMKLWLVIDSTQFRKLGYYNVYEDVFSILKDME